MNDDQHEGALLEDINDKLQRLAEGMSAIIESTQKIETVIAAIPEMKADIKIIKAVVTDQGRDLHRIDQQIDNHEARLNTLGRAA